MRPGPAEQAGAAGRQERDERARRQERDELARRQLSLVAALVARGAPPAGVDPGRVRIQAAALLRKRSRSVARRAPALATALGPDFRAAFQDYDAARSGLPPAGPAADTRGFARYLASPAGRAYAAPGVGRAARGLRRARWLRRGARFPL